MNLLLCNAKIGKVGSLILHVGMVLIKSIKGRCERQAAKANTGVLEDMEASIQTTTLYLLTYLEQKQKEALHSASIENEKLRSERDGALKQVSTLFQTVEYLTKESEKSKADLSFLQQEHKELVEEAEMMKDCKSQLEEENRKYMMENEILQGQQGLIESEKQQLLAELSELRYEKQALEADKEAIQAEKDILQSEKEQLTMENGAYKLEKENDFGRLSYIPETPLRRPDSRMSIMPSDLMDLRNIDVSNYPTVLLRYPHLHIL